MGKLASARTTGAAAAGILGVRRALLALLCGVTLTAAACGNDQVAMPSPPPVNLTGTWAGDLTVQGMPARMTWTLTQAGSTATGPVLVSLSSGVVLLNGALSGTLTGAVLTYSISVAAGGLPTQPTCTGQLGGSVTATSASTLTGAFTVVSSSCPTPLADGAFTLAKAS